MEECDKHHLLCQFNKEFYEVIEAFQGEHIINASPQLKDLQVKGNGNHIALILGVDT